MENSKRTFLERGKKISLSVKPDGSSPEEYIIQSVIGEGGSTVCYDAIRARDGMPGKLKEFYPIDAAAGEQKWYYSLERLPNGQLIPKGGTVRRFSEMCREYLGTYTLLNKVMADNPRNQVLKNYIQNGEILYGVHDPFGGTAGVLSSLKKKLTGTDQLGATVYVWSGGIMGQGFDLFLDDVRAHPDRDANYKLHDILNTVCTLTDCIRALHTAGLMHLDIKPGNFLVPYDSKNGINTASISLFDINTLYSIHSSAPRIAGTDGYRAPEVLKGRADNRSDIYSIGAMLFYGIVVSPEIPGGVYADAYYKSIDQLVRHSSLIVNSDSAVKLVSLVANILKKCLAPNPGNRYETCTDLLRDLKKAAFEAHKNAVDPALLGQNKALKVVERNEEGISAPQIVIQKLLYEYPLYEALPAGEGQINVLVVGSGTYGQKFIDHCLQAGQMKGCTLSVTAVSSTPDEDRQSYLQFRPALRRFVDVDGSMAGDPRSYASLRFVSLNEACQAQEEKALQFARGRAASGENTLLVRRITAAAAGRGSPFHYVFVALGSDQFNHDIARLFAQETAAQEGGVRCPVCYISERTRKAPGKSSGSTLYPVCINERITANSIDPQLEHMAFNAHIAWDGALGVNQNARRKEFLEDAYSYSSSLAFALSLKYKLFSIGIILQNARRPLDPGRFGGAVVADSVQDAARQYEQEVLARRRTDPQAQKKFDALVALEHRRWVLSMITEGWDAPLDESGRLNLEQCVADGKVRNEARRTHPCIVFSTEAAPLNGGDYAADGRKKWDDPRIDPNLDELDRMSVELHQRFMARANDFKADNPLKSEDMNAIEGLIASGGETVLRAFRQFQFCLKNILNGVESYTKQYRHYEKSFLKTLDKVPAEIRDKVEDRLRLIAKAFYPVIEANLYRNYKANDEVLVEKIPFILSYRVKTDLAMAFEDGKRQNGRNEAVFANVASATVLSPERIHYLYYYSRDARLELLCSKITAVLNYLGSRKARCCIDFAIAVPPEISDQKLDALQKALERLKAENSDETGAWLGGCEIIDCGGTTDAVEKFSAYLADHKADLYDGSTELFESLLDNAAFVSRLRSARTPYFEFDWRHKEFTKHEDCTYLRYIRDNSAIRISDMFSLMNAADTRLNLPEFAEDYTLLWSIYTGCYLSANRFEYGVSNWNRLCAILEKYEDSQSPIATIPLKQQPQARKELVYLLPEYTFSTVRHMLRKLTEFGAVEPGSAVSGYTSENCRVRIVTDSANESAFDKLFEHPERLLSFYGVEVSKRADFSGEYVQIKYNNMNVTGVNLDPEGKGHQWYLYQVLKKLSEHHFISQLTSKEDNRFVSFVYSSSRIKKLLTCAGEILEVYTYYQILSTGYFDDVACGYEFRWQDGDVKNELDIVATKGFRSIILECKAVKKLDRDYYHKLHSIAEHFGIGSLKVLVGNTYKKNDTELRNANAMQRSRGNQLNIITISKEREIVNIGQTLIDLMER